MLPTFAQLIDWKRRVCQKSLLHVITLLVRNLIFFIYTKFMKVTLTTLAIISELLCRSGSLCGPNACWLCQMCLLCMFVQEEKGEFHCAAVDRSRYKIQPYMNNITDSRLPFWNICFTPPTVKMEQIAFFGIVSDQNIIYITDSWDIHVSMCRV